jgi:hypothetical protein
MSLKSKLIKSVSFIAITFIGSALYGSYDSRKAHASEQQFCGAVEVGAPIEGLLEKAIAMGANKRMTIFFENAEKEKTLLASFNGVFVFDRYVCEITIADNLVKNVKQTRVD